MNRQPGGGFRDRRAGLVLFGVLSIVVGSFLGLLALVTPAALMAGKTAAAPADLQAIDLRSVLVGTFFYAVLAALFVWTGIGAIKVRRWVRPTTLVLAWTWLLLGLVGLIFWLLMLPNLRAMIEATQPGEPPLEAGAYTAISLIASAFIVLAYVVLPAAFVWFYQDRNVRATLEAFDPVPRWTDQCPAPVLGLSLGLWAAAVTLLGGLAYNIVPLFGFIVTGLPAALLALVLAAVCAWLGVAVYRLRMVGWWGTTILTLLLLAGSIVTLIRTDLMEVYRSLGVPQEQLAALTANVRSSLAAMILAMVVLGLASLAYMLYVRRYFLGPPGRSTPSRP